MDLDINLREFKDFLRASERFKNKPPSVATDSALRYFCMLWLMMNEYKTFENFDKKAKLSFEERAETQININILENLVKNTRFDWNKQNIFKKIT